MTCQYISNLHCVYNHVMSIFSIYLFFSQADFLLIRMAADLVVTVWTTSSWMEGKTVDPEKHDLEGTVYLAPVRSGEGEEVELLSVPKP
ncbi:MAG: hypothetical protein EB075_14615 [Bacteroidetes bacterium]|nr:hypothetical protein [Bacteroidota bacterium]